MSSKHTLIIVTILAMLMGLSISATAITYGEKDGDDHPYVGLILFEAQQSPIGSQWPCSGTLLSPTVVLTAGHCTFWAEKARVWFDSDLRNSPGYPSGGENSVEAIAIFTHPEFDGYASFPNTSDIGIVILGEEVYPGGAPGVYGDLPELDELDDLFPPRGRKAIIRTVGYGRQMVKPTIQWEPVRYTSTSMLVNLRSHLTDGYNIHTSNNPGKGQGTGGSCFGDSGGPILYPEDSNTVVGVVSFGLNSNCKGADFAYRTDIWDAREFIDPFLE